MGERLREPPPGALDDPYADDYTREFWDHAMRRVLSAPRCRNCGTFRLPPTRFCRRCRSQAIEYVPLPGTGTLYSFIVVRHPLRPEMADHIPYAPAIVEADGAPGCRFVSDVVNCAPDDVHVGMRLQVAWKQLSPTYVFPYWEPAAAA